MAGALRPVVILMLLGSVLFLGDAAIDGVPLGLISFGFALANTQLALLVASGSERSLVGRIVLSGFFLIERPVTAYALGPKDQLAIAMHLGAALIELIIFVGALRVWRLGHSVAATDVGALLDLGAPSPAAPAEPAEAPRPKVRVARGRRAWLIASLTLLLAAILVAHGVIAGFVPGGREWGVVGVSSGWLVYLFAAVALVMALPAAKGGRLGLRVLFALALILFIERAFSPFALRTFEPVALGIHALAAFVSLALALATAGAIRATAGAAPIASPQAS